MYIVLIFNIKYTVSSKNGEEYNYIDDVSTYTYLIVTNSSCYCTSLRENKR